MPPISQTKFQRPGRRQAEHDQTHWRVVLTHSRLRPDPLRTKLCNGPSHDEPTELPLSEFYVHKSGRRKGLPVSRCKRCINWDKLKNHHANHGTVPSDEIQPFLREMVNRVGLYEASRLSGIAPNTIPPILDGTTKRVQKRTAMKILSTVDHQRRNGILYHKKDIAAGVRTKKKFRRIEAPWEQYGPVYPELEARWRAELATARREARRRQREREDALERLTGY